MEHTYWPNLYLNLVRYINIITKKKNCEAVLKQSLTTKIFLSDDFMS